MRKQNLVVIRPIAVLISALLIAITSSAFAANSNWYKAQNSQFRLISASRVSNTKKDRLIAGVEIQLADGWKTYWRSPGDGLATEIDMSASENVAEARILWPVPKRFDGAGGVTSYGYKHSVVLPILLKPSNPNKAVFLRAELVYGVCADICIPVEGTAELNIPLEDDSEYAAVLANALGQVPKKQTEGVNCSHRFTSAQLNSGDDTPVLLIKTAYDSGVAGLNLFVERENGLALPPAELVSEPASGQSVYAVRFDNADDAASLRGEQLVLTMTSDQGSCETSWRME